MNTHPLNRIIKQVKKETNPTSKEEKRLNI